MQTGLEDTVLSYGQLFKKRISDLRVGVKLTFRGLYLLSAGSGIRPEPIFRFAWDSDSYSEGVLIVRVASRYLWLDIDCDVLFFAVGIFDAKPEESQHQNDEKNV